MKKELLLYLLFGILTTLVYFVARFVTVNLSGSSMLAVIIAQSLSIIFAFVTNKILVFRDVSIQWVVILKQFSVFVMGRMFVLLLDVFITYFAVEKFSAFFIKILKLNNIDYSVGLFSFGTIKKYFGSPFLINELIFALIVQILAIILNYIISKKVVFTKK
ncbi:GtrA family protein [Listeria sp. PSOL-1]|uniref:GtrA family protein n=1 Tax=Listeria sp. PSOL-1 TaxID=1844999 RepID=UPI0013D16EBA|nr:GtrA family protein [Listeria sp. PSOL-1]